MDRIHQPQPPAPVAPRPTRLRRLISPRGPAVRGALVLLLAGASLWWLRGSAHPDQVLSVLRSAHLSPVMLAIALLLASLAAKSVRWRLLLPQHAALSRSEAYRIFHVSQFLNNVLPLRAGDLFRLRSAARFPSLGGADGMRAAFLSLVAERLIDAVCLFGVSLLVLPIFMRAVRTPDHLPLGPLLRERPILALALLTALAALVLVFRLGRRRAVDDPAQPLAAPPVEASPIPLALGYPVPATLP
ncbi:MAG TPA: lysylphosphatidylglycerol synthase domain-containing protein, partial [Miltoncostaeaceae bacterium]|nr:lysylphosphatidylglycerol synthase domain-containing protein [Miltoncostaeaceae bacterium]